VAELPLAKRADVNIQDNYGWTPLHFAMRWRHKDRVELLPASKAHVGVMADLDRIHSQLEGWIIYIALDIAEKYSHKDLAKLLRQHGGHE
jgi:ankyrin repeat protein